jgi:hypothetical protein
MINKTNCLACGRKSTNPKFCSKSCANTFNNKKIAKELLKQYLENPNYCLYCNKAILPKKDKRLCETKYKKFCDNSCATKYNNYIRYGEPKAKIRKEKKFKVNESIIIGSLYRKNASKYVLVREKARAKMDFYKIEKKCVICGYNTHVEVHHKRFLNTYPDDTLLSVVNDLENLMYLCPTHHWEADHNILNF